MKKHLFLIVFLLSSLLISEDKWLKEVKPIITKSELKVYKSLKTEEEKEKFREYFWKSRDPDPQTPVNEYKVEYYKRAKYAKEKLGGINSDRGRVYIYLGKPLEIKTYRGYEKIVSCELWIYQRKNRKDDLPPFMNLLFYKPGDMGDYRLFYPGIQTAFDLLSPSFINHAKSRMEAFRLLKMDFPELAQASLSVIPMEGSPLFNIPNSSSGRVISKIFSIPEKIVNKSYLSLFKASSGIVEVEYSFKEIYGKLIFNKSEKAGFNFISYSINPDHIIFSQKGENHFLAKIQIIARLENLKGNVLLEKSYRANLKVSRKRKEEIERYGVTFNGFIPVIPENVNLKIFFYNMTSKEYFTGEAKIDASAPVYCIGFNYKYTDKGLSPFQYEDIKIIVNPKLIFGKDDIVSGVFKSNGNPFLFLVNIDSGEKHKIKDIEKTGNFYFFKLKASSVPEGGYFLSIKDNNREFKTKSFAIIPYKKNKPIILEKEDKNFNIFKYIFYLGEEYLNDGKIKKAISFLKKIPETFRERGMLQIYGRAYYLNGNYEKVINLIEPIKGKDYPLLALLANSYLKINNLKKAAYYFEKIRKYGDTVAVNNKLGALYFSLGDKKKAKIYWERAKKLKSKEEK